MQSSLRDVNKLLKLDPTNTELLNQKQKLLQQSIQETETRLKTLKQASEQAAKTAGNYDAWKRAYTPIQQEIEKTNGKLDTLKKKMKSMEEAGEIDTEEYKELSTKVEESTKSLEELKQKKKQVDEEFGHPISPEGMDALQREIVETTNEYKALRKEVGSANADLAKVSAVTGKVGEKATAAGKKMLPLTGVLGGIGVASVSMANNFEDAMSQAAGALDKPMSEMEELRQLAIKTGQDTIFSATEAGNAITELAKGGLTEAEIKAGALQTTMDLAASSGMGLGDAANVVVQAMGAFGLEANKSAEAANALAGAAAASSTDVEPLTQALAQCSSGAKNAGWTIQETTAVLGRFADAGIEGSDAGTSLKVMLQKLAAPASDKAADMIEDLGLKTRDSSGQLLGATEMAQELQDKLGGLDAASRDAALSTIFGSDAMRAATVLMNSGEKGLQKYIKATNDQEAAQRLANSQMGDGSRAIEELKGSLETAGIQIGDTLAPIIQKLAEIITNLVNKFSALPEGVQQAIVIIGILVAAIGPLLIVIGKISTGISAITGAMSKISGEGGTIMKMITKMKGLVKSLFGLIMAHPVIAVITAIVAVLVVLYNKCEWFRDAVNAVWDAVKKGFFAAWDAIVKFFTETIPEAWNNTVSFFQGIPEWWNGIWTSVKTKFEEVWTAMMANPIINALATYISQMFENLKITLSGIWDGIKTAAAGAWELIKNAILGPVLLLIDLVLGDFDKLREDAEKIWSNMQEAAQKFWSGIEQVVTSLVEGIVNAVKIRFEALKNTVSAIWNETKNAASNIWNGIKTTVSNLANNTKEAAVNGFNAMKDGISNAISSIPDMIRGIFDKVRNIIENVISSAWEWGSDFIEGLKEGIMSGVKGIINTIEGIADKIRSLLHFSRPDEGPLRDYEAWMPDFIDGMVKGLDRNVYKISDAVGRVARTISDGMGSQSLLTEAGGMSINLNNAVNVQIGNKNFDSYIVKTAQAGIGSAQKAGRRARGH